VILLTAATFLFSLEPHILTLALTLVFEREEVEDDVHLQNEAIEQAR
jgi:hypothetical protein